MFLLVFFGIIIKECTGQAASPFDLGDHREGQLSGQLSPLNIFAIALSCFAALVACAITGVCAYFTWKRYIEEKEMQRGSEYSFSKKTGFA